LILERLTPVTKGCQGPAGLNAGKFGHPLTNLSHREVLTYMASLVPSDPPPSVPTVLVLDDEPFVRHAARRFLKGSGYECVEAETVEIAMDALRKTPVIAAMLDMRLSDGRTGLDVLTSLRALPEFREIPVLIVTGSILSDAEKAAIAKLRGFVFFKPEGFSTIVNFLDHMTGRDQSG
jgi:CheY-like chemotaxis protein